MRRLSLRLSACLAALLALAGPAPAVELDAALRGAESQDPTLAAARASRDAAAENIPLARSRLLPQISFQASEQRLRQEITSKSQFGPATSEFIGPSRNQQLVLRQGVYKPRDYIGTDIGELQAEYGRLKLGAATSELWSRTTGAWLDMLAARSLRDAASEGVPGFETLARQVRERLARGDGTRDAVVESEAQLAAARARLREAEAIVDARQRNLALATGLLVVATDERRLPQQLPTPLAPSDTEFADLVMARNFDLLAASAAESVGRLRIEQARADGRPVVDFVTSASRAINDSTSTVGQSYRSIQYGFQISIPLYSGGGLTAAERQAEASAQGTVAEREAFAQQLRQRITVLWETERGLRERIGAASELVASSREQMRAAQQGLNFGVRSVGDISFASTTIANRQRDLIELRQNLLLTQVQLLAMLPVDAPEWAVWTGAVDSLARQR